MSTSTRKYIFLTLVIIISSILHATMHNNLISFVIAPFVIATTLAYTMPSAPILFGLVIISELLSLLPPGVLTLALAVPFGIHRLFPARAPQLSLPFFLLTATIALLQVVIVGIVSLIPAMQMYMWQRIWQILPVWPAVATIVGTASVSFVFLILWYELFPPQQESSLKPRTTSLR